MVKRRTYNKDKHAKPAKPKRAARGRGVVGFGGCGVTLAPPAHAKPSQATKRRQAKKPPSLAPTIAQPIAHKTPDAELLRFYIKALEFKKLSNVNDLGPQAVAATLDALAELCAHPIVSALTAHAVDEADFNPQGGWGLPTFFQFRYQFTPPKNFYNPRHTKRARKNVPNLLPRPIRGATPLAIATKALNSLAVPRLPQGHTLAPNANDQAATARLKHDKKTWSAHVNLRKASIPIVTQKRPSLAELHAFGLALIGLVQAYGGGRV